MLVLNVKNIERQSEIAKKLDKGEASSIALALEIQDSILIIDEIKGRELALSLKIEIIGTIGILLLANKNGLLKDVIGTVLKLVNKGFRLSDKIVENLIEKYNKK